MKERQLHILFLGDPHSQNTRTWIAGFEELGCKVSVASARVDKQEGNVYPIGVRFLPPKLRILTAVNDVKELIKKLRPDILIAYRVTSYGFLAVKTGFYPIVTAAQNEYITWTSEKIPFLKLLMTLFANRAIAGADMLHAWGDNIKKGLLKYGASEEKIFVLHRGIDTDIFHRKNDINDFPLKSPVLISTRSLNKEYKIDLLISAFAELLKELPDAKLIICGDGPERKNLEMLAAKLHCNNNIIFTGRLSAEGIAKELRRADIYISLIDTEGISSSLIEAACAGVLPIVVDMPASREVIDTPNAALFLDKNKLSPIYIKDKIKEAAASRQIASGAFKNALKVASHFNRRTNLKLFIEEYKKRFNIEPVMAPHVCHISTSHSPFDIRIFHRECKGLQKLGYKVSIVTRSDEREEKIVDGIRIIPVRYILGKLGRKFILPKIAVTKARKLNADVYHFHDVELLPWMCMLAKHHNAKVIWDAHELYSATIKEFYVKHFPPLAWILSSLYSKLEKLWCGAFAGIIAVTEPITRRYLNMGFNCVTIKNVIDMERVKLLHKDISVKKSSRFTIIISGTTNKSRCIDKILEAIKLIKEKKYDVVLKILTDFDSKRDEKKIKKEIKRLNIEDNVSISSVVPWEQLIKEEIPSAHIGLALYRKSENNCVGIPNRLFEYWACKIPVIATDTPLLVSIIGQYGGGITVDSDIPAQIAEAVIQYMDNPDRILSDGNKGYLAVQQEFTWTNELKKLDAFYTDIISPGFSNRD